MPNPFARLRLGTLNARRMAFLLSVITRLPRFVYRFTLNAFSFARPRHKYEKYIRLLKKQGYVYIPRGELPVEPILADSDAYVRRQQSDQSSEMNSKKSYLIPLVTNDDYSSLQSLVDFATSEDLVGIVSAYLKSLPVLTYLNIWYSPNKPSEKMEGSQLWHLDHESYRQVKVFLYLNDVDAKAGPTRIFTKGYSLREQKKLKYRLGHESKHFSDGLDESQSLSLTGKRGDIVILDTSSCFHRGSDGAGSPRYLCTAQYLPIYAFSRNKFSSLKGLKSSEQPFYQDALLGG
jgi:hypothetical protein